MDEKHIVREDKLNHVCEFRMVTLNQLSLYDLQNSKSMLHMTNNPFF